MEIDSLKRPVQLAVGEEGSTAYDWWARQPYVNWHFESIAKQLDVFRCFRCVSV